MIYETIKTRDMVTWVGLDCFGFSFSISAVLLYIQTPGMYFTVCLRLSTCTTISIFCECVCWHSTGSLIQVPMSEKGKITRGRLGSLSLKKEGERQCFLFSKHLIICTRGSGGKLHITKVHCRINLVNKFKHFGSLE